MRELVLLAFSAVLLVATPERFASLESAFAKLGGQINSYQPHATSEEVLATQPELQRPLTIDLTEALADQATALFGDDETSEPETNYVEMDPALLSPLPTANN